jgi:hypothetical protein
MLKAYAVGTVERNPAIPNVPTSKEAGLPEFQAAPWFALFTPKRTPQSVRDMLSDALDKTPACVSVCSTSAAIYRPRPHDEVSSRSRYWLRAKLPAGCQS